MFEALAALALGCGVLALGCAGWAATRAVPARLHRAVREMTEARQLLEDEWRAHRASLDAWQEEAGGVLESVERKRARIAGAVSKIQAADGRGGPEPDYQRDPEGYERYWNERARQRGLL